MGSPPGAGWLAANLAWPGQSEADRLPDEDDVDASGELLVDLEDLADEAVLSVGGIRPSVLKFQAVPVDPLVCGVQGGDEFLRANEEDDVGGTQA